MNSRIKRYNPYLIQDAILEHWYEDDESGKHIPCGLVVKLDFDSKKEVLWGTNSEIKLYIKDLFYLLWEKVCVNSDTFDSDLYLCDYIPYAKYSAYWNILFDNHSKNDPRFTFAFDKGTPFRKDRVLNYPAFAFGVSEDTIIDNIDTARDEALTFLYDKCKKEFLSDFLKFANITDSFHMLNNTIKKYISNVFIPMIEKYKPDSSSLGLRVRKLIFDDLSYSAVLFFNHYIENRSFRVELLNASKAYIKKLEEIQRLYHKTL